MSQDVVHYGHTQSDFDMNKDYFENEFSSMERNADGTWSVFNDVTGMIVAPRASYSKAVGMLQHFRLHYRALM